jgi:transcriptional regulator with GAF, ATPase, and Fis domain/serine/threonine protein kinase
MQELIGTIIANHYRLDRIVGEGGMSFVFEGTDLYTGQNAAIKVLKKGKTSSRIEDIFRFRREATLVSQLKHPNLVRVYEVGEHSQLYYIAMELIQGTRLDQFVKAYRSIGIDMALSIITQVTETLAYVHSAGVVHRDIKPGNIMIVSDGYRAHEREGIVQESGKNGGEIQIKILDFGLSQVMELAQIKEREVIIGTFSYMSPEQTGIIRKPVDERSDLYSLGIVFYELITGELPFKGTEIGTIVHQQIAQNPVPPTRINGHVPPTVEKIVLKLIHKDPNERYQTAYGLLQDLRRCKASDSGFVLGKEDRLRKLTYRTRLIGREEEGEKLHGLHLQAARERGSVCLVSGEAGQGKSRLVSEMRDDVYERGGEFLYGKCFNQENKIPYQPFSEALTAYLSEIEHLPSKERDRRVRRMKASAGEHGEIICRLNPEIREVFGDVPSLVKLDPEKEHKRFIMVCARFFQDLGESGKPVVIVLDDLQWCDEGSLSLLEEILEEIARAPLLILGTYRGDEIAPDHSLRRIIQRGRERKLPLEAIHLEPFDLPEVQRLIGELLAEDDNEVKDIAQYIHRRSKGNVMHALEIVRQLVEGKVLEFRQGKWEFNREMLDEIRVPDTMVEVIQNRIQLLESDHAEMLSVASVMGSTFEMDLLYALTDSPQEKVIHWIDAAFELQLLEKGPERGDVAFVHDRIHEAFYQRLDMTKRRHLHARIASAIEELHRAKTRDVLFDLAHHYYEAAETEKCLHYALPAADEAGKSYANEDAIKYYTIALNLLEDKGDAESSDWVRAKEGLLEVYSTIGNIEMAIRIGRELLDVKRGSFEKARVYRSIGRNFFRKSDYQNAEDNLALGLLLLGKRLPKTKAMVALGIAKEILVHLFHRSLPMVYSYHRVKRIDESDKEIALLYEACTLLYVLGYYLKFFYATLKLMNFSESRLGKSRELAGALMGYAMTCAGIPWFRRSVRYHHIALEMKEDLGDQTGVAQSLRYLGFTHLMMGDYDKAENFFQAARLRFLAIGDLYELTHVLNGLNLVYHHRTDPDKRDDVVSAMLAISRRIENSWGISVALESFGGTYVIRGDFEAAEEWLKKAEEFSRNREMWLAYCLCHAIYSQLYLEKDDYERAIYHADFACRVEGEHNLIKPIVALVYIYRADAYIARFREKMLSARSSERKHELKTMRPMVKEMTIHTWRWPTLRGIALRTKAEFCFASGNYKRAQHLFLASIRKLKSIDRSFELAKSHYQYGNFLKDRGMDEEARKQWYQAFNIFRRLGAKVYEKRASACLGIREEPFVDSRDLIERGRLASLLQVSRDISSILNVEELLKSIMAKAVEVTGAQRGYLFIVNENKKELELKIRHNIEQDDHTTLQFSRSIVNKVFTNGETIIATNASQDTELGGYLSVVNYDLKSILCLPIRHHYRTLGVCYLDNPLSSGVFSHEDAELLKAFMAQSAICVANATAYDKISVLNKELKKEGERIKEENRKLKNLVRLSSTHIRSFGDIAIVTQDPAMVDLIDEADRFAQTTANVLITGESGVGKEIFAHLIHMNSNRKAKPFVKVNCAAIPDSLFESEFFGYEKGAFTGAVKTKRGKFELADGGTIFLDEVGEFPLAQQAKLLRILEDSEITRVGGGAPVKVDVKVITATNKDLGKRVKDGRFREDLYFRLNVLHMHVPSLMDRRDDIPILASYFLSQIANLEGGREKYFDDTALLFLKELHLPGNVRELKNLIHRAYLSTEKDVITREDIEDCRLREVGETRERPEPRPSFPERGEREGDAEPLFEKSIPFKKFKEMFETRYLMLQLKKHHYNVSRTAKSLDLQPSALFRKLKSLDIKVDKSVR